MKLVPVVLVAFVAVVAANNYTTMYDNINLDEILNNDRLYKRYFDCLVGKGKCTPDGKELKRNLPQAIQTDCSKCSEKQREGSEKVLRFMLTNKKNDYAELEKIYDPAETYRKKYE